MRYGVRYLVARRRRELRTKTLLSMTRLILEELAAFGEATLSAFFPAKYPQARLWRSLLDLDKKYRFKRESFSTLLWRLRAQGLVERSLRAKGTRWRLTSGGWSRLRAEHGATSARSDGIRRLVIFDIPEQERKKRDILRYELAAAGYTQLQKSVWSGECPLPREFVELIETLGVRRYLHIFSVRDSGTLGRSTP